MSFAFLFFLLGRIHPRGVLAHPSAIEDGRATCGAEYDTQRNAYVVDIKDAWFARRVATCESPYFWVKFEVTEVDQPVYIATILRLAQCY